MEQRKKRNVASMFESLSLLSVVLSVCIIIGGAIALRQGFHLAASEAQGRAINALQSEMEALHSRIAALEQENTRLSQTLTTISVALKQRGIHITIDGDMVSIHDVRDRSSSYSTNSTNRAKNLEGR
jgi:cell division protein FtsB